MLGWFKNRIIRQKQLYLKRRFPKVNIVFHSEIPLVSVNKIISLVPLVDKINQLEPQVSKLSDLELRKKTEVFKDHVLKKSKEYQPQIEELKERFISSATDKEKVKIKELIKEDRELNYQFPNGFSLV